MAAAFKLILHQVELLDKLQALTGITVVKDLPRARPIAIFVKRTIAALRGEGQTPRTDGPVVVVIEESRQFRWSSAARRLA